MGIAEKRERVDALRAEIEQAKQKYSVAAQAANDQVREATLDREIDRLEAELAAINTYSEPTPTLTAVDEAHEGVAAVPSKKNGGAAEAAAVSGENV